MKTRLLAAFLLWLASSPASQTARLYTDAGPGSSPCAKQSAGSADWMLQNVDKDRPAIVLLDRVHTEDGKATHTGVAVVLAPGETRKLGCSTWTDEKGRPVARSFTIRLVKLR